MPWLNVYIIFREMYLIPCPLAIRERYPWMNWMSNRPADKFYVGNATLERCLRGICFCYKAEYVLPIFSNRSDNI